MKLSNFTTKNNQSPIINEDYNEMPELGDTIRTKKSQIDGKVEKISESGEVFFRIADGRLMKTPCDNVTVVEKLADGEQEVMENKQLDEVSDKLLARYKGAASKQSAAADKEGDIKKGDKRFRGIVKATNKQFAHSMKDMTKEGSMGGVNRSHPSQDVSYEKVLDRNPKSSYSEVVGEDLILASIMEKWEQERIDELSVNKLKDYAGKVKSVKPQHDKVKTVNHIKGYQQAKSRIATKTGDRTGITGK